MPYTESNYENAIIQQMQELDYDYVYGPDVERDYEDPLYSDVLEASIRRVITEAAATDPGIRIDIKRLLLAQSLQPLPGNAPLVQAIQQHGEAVFGQPIPTCGTPLYTDVRLYCAQGIPAVIYGAGPRTVFESNAKRADEHLVLDDLRKATKVVARTLFDLLH